MFLSPASSFLIKVLLGIVLLPNSFAGPTLCKLLHKVGAFKLLGLKGKYPKNTILKKLDFGDRNIKNDYVKYCHWRGKKIASIERRRYAEFLLLFDS